MFEALFTLCSVCFLLLGSPGPAPLALAASGATFGVRESFPFLLGVLAGLMVAIFTAAIGLAALFSVFPKAKIFIQIVGALYILFIAYKIAFAPVTTDNDGTGNAPSVLNGFLLNLLNPKAYAAFVAIFSQFLLPIKQPHLALLGTGLVCFFVATLVDIMWLAFGGVIGPVFKKPRQARILRILFAVLMLIAVAWALRP